MDCFRSTKRFSSKNMHQVFFVFHPRPYIGPRNSAHVFSGCHAIFLFGMPDNQQFKTGIIHRSQERSNLNMTHSLASTQFIQSLFWPYKFQFSAPAGAPYNSNVHWGKVFSCSDKKVVLLMLYIFSAVALHMSFYYQPLLCSCG
jgi:hypothetical protein